MEKVPAALVFLVLAVLASYGELIFYFFREITKDVIKNLARRLKTDAVTIEGLVSEVEDLGSLKLTKRFFRLISVVCYPLAAYYSELLKGILGLGP